MRAIDTNVVVRFLTADHAREHKTARDVIEAGDIFVPITVCLETEWVLRSAYDLTTDQVALGLRGLAGLSGVTVEEPAALAAAIDAMVDGMDFADALHLARSETCTSFVTLDRSLAKASKKRSGPRVELL